MKQKNRTTFIYGLIDPEKSDIIRYVGKTNNMKSRLIKHISESKKSKSYKNNWIKKLIFQGRKPEMILLKEVSINEWKCWEIFYINKYNNSCLTNVTKGGDGGILDNKYKELSLKKWKQVVQIDFDTREILNTFLNISDAANYIKAKSRSRISDCCNEKINTSYGYIWRFLDENGDIIETKKIERFYGNRKRVAKIDVSTNGLIDIYSSLSEAANKNNIDVGAISACCLGKQKHAGNYTWRRVDNDDKIIQPKIKNPPKQVAMLDFKDNVIKIFINSSQAAKYVGLKQGDTILKSCRDNKSYAAEYRWRFYDNNSEMGIL